MYYVLKYIIQYIMLNNKYTEELKRHFYKEDLHYTNIHIIYVNSSNNIEKIRKEIFYMSTPNFISRDEIFEILKKNSIHNEKKYTILSILKFEITIDGEEIIQFLKRDYNDNQTIEPFLTSIKNIEAITFSKSIHMFHDLTDVLFVFYEKGERNIPKQDVSSSSSSSSNHNITKKIYLHKNNQRMTRKIR